MLKPINLQLFAEGDTSPAKQEESDSVQDKNPFERLYEKFSGKQAETKEPAKEPDIKPAEVKPPEAAEEEPKTKDPEKEPPEDEEIVYNGKKVKVMELPWAERKTYLQKGMNYDKIKTEADTAKATLKRAAQAEGFSTVDEYVAELTSREKVRLAEQLEEAAGDPTKIDEIVQNHPEVVRTREERRRLEFANAKAQLSKDQFFKELEPQFEALMEQNPTAAPDLIYKLVRSDYLTPERIQEFIAKEKAQTERKILADVHDKERRAAPKGGDAGDGKDVVQPSDFTKKLAGAFGISPQKVAQRVYEKTKRS